MEYDIYKYSAIVGCTLVGLQVVLQIIGLGGDADADAADADAHAGHVDADGHGNAFFGILSFKALCAFAGIFGLTGLTVWDTGFSFVPRVALAGGAGFAGMLFVGWMMRSLSRLQSSGTIEIRNAIGRSGTVYLTIPGGNAGRGKVTVEVQGRLTEFLAVTDGEELKTGARVTVTGVEGGDVLKVARD